MCGPDDIACGSWWNVSEDKRYLGVQCTGFCVCDIVDHGPTRTSFLLFGSWCRKTPQGVHCEDGWWDRVQNWSGGSTWICRNYGATTGYLGTNSTDAPQAENDQLKERLHALSGSN